MAVLAQGWSARQRTCARHEIEKAPGGTSACTELQSTVVIKLSRYVCGSAKQAKFVCDLYALAKEVRRKPVISVSRLADVQEQRCRYNWESVAIPLCVPKAEALCTEAGLKVFRPLVFDNKSMLQSQSVGQIVLCPGLTDHRPEKQRVHQKLGAES